MATRKLLTYPHQALRRRAEPVVSFPVSQDVLDDMRDTLLHADRGAALAANQIGIDLQLFVVSDELKQHFGTDFFVNPSLGWMSDEDEELIEGCLSFPGIQLFVKRKLQVTLVAQQPHDGSWVDVHLSGFAARVAQHEVDHLDGVLFIDELPSKAKQRVIERMKLLKSGRL